MSKWHSPLRASGGYPPVRSEWGREGAGAARAVHRLPALATESAPAGPGLGSAARSGRRGARGGALKDRAGCSGRTVQLFPCASFALSLPLHFLALSLFPWLVNNKKEEEGGKRFPKKVDCKEAVGFRPLPHQPGYVRLPFSVFLHLQSKSGGKRGAGGASGFSPEPVLFPVSFPHTCPAAAVIKAPSVIFNAPRSPAAAPQRN